MFVLLAAGNKLIEQLAEVDGPKRLGRSSSTTNCPVITSSNEMEDIESIGPGFVPFLAWNAHQAILSRTVLPAFPW